MWGQNNNLTGLSFEKHPHIWVPELNRKNPSRRIKALSQKHTENTKSDGHLLCIVRTWQTTLIENRNSYFHLPTALPPATLQTYANSPLTTGTASSFHFPYPPPQAATQMPSSLRRLGRWPC